MQKMSLLFANTPKGNEEYQWVLAALNYPGVPERYSFSIEREILIEDVVMHRITWWRAPDDKDHSHTD